MLGGVKMKKQYDLIVSIGAACPCTTALRAQHLQDFSYPFDWLFGSTLSTRADILVNDFKGWFDKEDLTFVREVPDVNGMCYMNNKTGLCYNHDFKKDKTFDAQYPEIKAKYDRRIARLLEKAETAENILLVYIEKPNCTEQVPDNELLKIEKVLQKRFGNKVDLLYLFRNTDSFKNKTDVFVSPHVRKVIFDYQLFTKKNEYSVNKRKLKAVLKHYKLNRPLIRQIQIRIKSFLIHFCALFILNKRKRKDFKRKWKE